MLNSSCDKSIELQDHVETIMEGLQTVSNVLAVKKVGFKTILSLVFKVL